MRTLAALLAALNAVAPSFGPKLEAAHELQRIGERKGFDPLLIVAVVKRESDWAEHAVGDKGELGLGQVMPANYVACQPSGSEERCGEIMRLLLQWRFNLWETGIVMTEHRAYCERVVGSGLAVFWLQEYQGYRGTCGHVKRHGRWQALPVPKGTRDVLARWHELRRRFE